MLVVSCVEVWFSDVCNTPLGVCVQMVLVVQRVLHGLSSPVCWLLVCFSMEFRWVGKVLLLSKTTREHCQVRLKLMVMLSLAAALGLCQSCALERSLGFRLLEMFASGQEYISFHPGCVTVTTLSWVLPLS